MFPYLLNEDTHPAKLFVGYSAKINDKIACIKMYNRKNKQAIKQLDELIGYLKDFLGNRSIAFDYGNQFVHLKNGALCGRVLGFDIMYSIVDDNRTGEPFVYVFRMTFDLSIFGLKAPPSLRTNQQNKDSNDGVIRLYEADIRAIVQETLKRILYN